MKDWIKAGEIAAEAREYGKKWIKPRRSHRVATEKIEAKILVEKHDVTENVELVGNIEENAQKYLETIKDECEPPITISVNCNKPYECSLKAHCWGTLPTNNVLHLTNWRQYWKFFHQ